jgi:hypothetical protein
MELGQQVESYRFWDIVTQWGRETLQHEWIVARALAKGVLRDGLRMQSVDARWIDQGTFELRGEPLVGYIARKGGMPIFIRRTALKHLTDMVETAAEPDARLLHEEFVTRQDFHLWVKQQGLTPPAFWFGR